MWSELKLGEEKIDYYNLVFIWLVMILHSASRQIELLFQV